jgi:hypothetical protein
MISNFEEGHCGDHEKLVQPLVLRKRAIIPIDLGDIDTESERRDAIADESST